MVGEQKRILIIDDSTDNIKLLINMLKADYSVVFATNGKDGIDIVQKKHIDLILLDIMMDGMDGYEVCRRLKLDLDTADIPIMFVTAVSESMDEAKGFSVGGVDYITKPFVPVVVLARIQNQLKLASAIKELKLMYTLALDANPITKLPGNNSIVKHVSKLLEDDEKRVVLYVDLDNFKAYNDSYGFANGDKVIFDTVRVMKEAAKTFNVYEQIFLGHIGGDDFVITIDCAIAEDFVNHFLKEFDEMIKGHYNPEDLARGTIRVKNRFGYWQEFPIITISIAGVDLCKTPYDNYFKLIDNCTAMKKKAKKIQGSVYIKDQRNR